MILTIISSK